MKELFKVVKDKKIKKVWIGFSSNPLGDNQIKEALPDIKTIL